VIQKTINIVLEVRSKIVDESDMMWTSFTTAVELRDEIDEILLGLRNEDLSVIRTLNAHFAAASTFQDHAIQNNWSERYMELADEFDKIYEHYTH